MGASQRGATRVFRSRTATVALADRPDAGSVRIVDIFRLQAKAVGFFFWLSKRSPHRPLPYSLTRGERREQLRLSSLRRRALQGCAEQPRRASTLGVSTPRTDL